MFACEKKEKASQYDGVTWHKRRKKWYAQLHVKGYKLKYGGTFNDELDAANRVNQLCEDLGILPQNPTISVIPNEQYKVTKKCSFVL